MPPSIKVIILGLIKPYIELKGSPTESQIHNLVDIVKRNGMLINSTWISFNADLLAYVKSKYPAARLGFTVASISSGTITTAKNLKNDVNDVFINTSSYTNSEINLCIENDFPVEVWTINNTETLVNIHSYVTGIASDSLHAGKLLNSYYMED